jgi:predicted GNAT family acetyltransferase
MTSQSAPAGDGVAVADQPEQSRYVLTLDDEPVGLIDYRISKGTMAMLHAEIDPAHAGQGLGSRMARAALDDARARDLAVVPMCPFVAAFVHRHPDEYADLVA